MLRKIPLKAVAFLSLLTFVGAAPLSAHHSFAMFDNDKEVELTGTVRQFQWTNPHSWIQLTVVANGKSVDYSVEGQSPNSLTRQGWSKNSLKVGDKVKMKIHPLRNGSPGGSFVSATFSNGKVLLSKPKD